ncbi:hypothetical protein RY831_05130 [Noviherbaspirillum sp. CPCC 100848]|uniref:Uncharacterized protein n=1 Tax=Noviherbaspirillum album TaxID=3080276 RepID=A0ABU6J4H7_9BURK|nr:hypothetical protein [Noviherbaspirillum sp. CPCC 100848]MEC4718519.1 hypothetical protein [Noviherbaspirillum sp. CPCC 100848]
MSASIRTVLAACIAAGAFTAHAQNRAPAAQYWVDLSTTSMSIPGMPEEASVGGTGVGLLGGLMGGNPGAAAMGAMGGMGGRGKSLDAELHVRAKPAGVEGTHAIPAAMNMGPSLLLTPYRPQPASHGGTHAERNDTPERPKGRILMYWGCGDSIAAGQPRILDFAKQNASEYAQFFSSHAGASKGVQNRAGNALWPNERDSKRVPDNASLQGEHAVSGEGVPPSLKFSVSPEYDFLPRASMTAKGQPRDGVQLGWPAMQHAKAYFLHAQGAARGPDGAQDMIIWSSSAKPENGWALMSYQSPAQVAKLLQQKIVLQPNVTNCTIPKGIFDKAEGAMVNMIAYGPELNVSHPPRPAKAPADWQPEWTARVRIKSTGMTMLGMAEGANNADSANNAAGAHGTDGAGGAVTEAQDSPLSLPLPGVPNPVKVLKGLFGG